jgi:hypothetical protein
VQRISQTLVALFDTSNVDARRPVGLLQREWGKYPSFIRARARTRGQLDAQPINAAMSTLAVQAAGAAAIAMASATAPSILPDDRFFDSLRFPAGSRSAVALAMHIVRTG